MHSVVCGVLPYGLMGPPALWRGAPGTAPAELRPSSSSPSSVSVMRRSAPKYSDAPPFLLSHTVGGHVLIHNYRERERERASEIRG